MKYKVIFNSHNPDLEAEVNFLLNEGWQLHGGLVAATGPKGIIVAMQAMVFVCTDKQKKGK